MDTQERDFKGIWIPKEIWLNEDLTALEKVILMEIDSLDNEDGCYASNQYLAEFCQCSENKVSVTISKLMKLGYVELVHFNGRIRRLKTNLDPLKNKGRLFKKQRQTMKKEKAVLLKNKHINLSNNIDNNIDDDISIISMSNSIPTDDNDLSLQLIDTIDIPTLISDKISLAELKKNNEDKHQEIDMLNNIICEVLSNKNLKATVRISKQNVPIKTVQSVFASLERKHIEYVINSLNHNDNKHKIKTNTKSYLMTALFHSVRTIEYYNNQQFDTTPVNQNQSPSFDVNDFFRKAVNKSMNDDMEEN